ncbi:MAG: class I SAM-dependent methyltransferase [Burkholderiales bacterium]
MAGYDDARSVWDARFATDEYIFGTEPNRFLVGEAHRLAPGALALSVADGEGRNSVWLATRGLTVEAVEISPRAVEKAQRLAAEHGVTVHFEVADVRAWPWPTARYDVIAAIFIQFAAPDERARLFAQFRRALVPGGLLLVEGYRRQQIEYATGGPPQVENLYTREMLEAAFDDFDILLLEEREDWLEEGVKHVGRSALVDLVARKRNQSDFTAGQAAAVT